MTEDEVRLPCTREDEGASREHDTHPPPPGGRLGSAGARVPCWVWPGTAWPSSGCCFAAASTDYSQTSAI